MALEQNHALAMQGPTADGGLERFLQAAEQVSLYGQLDLIVGSERSTIYVSGGKVVLGSVTTRSDHLAAFQTVRGILQTTAASQSGMYRCGPLTNLPKADSTHVVSIAELLGTQQRQRSTDQPLPTTTAPLVTPQITTTPEPSSTLAPRAVPHAPQPGHSATPAPEMPQNRSTDTGTTPPVPVQPLRASQIRRILDSLDDVDTSVPELVEESTAPKSRRSALRSIIRSLASS